MTPFRANWNLNRIEFWLFYSREKRECLSVSVLALAVKYMPRDARLELLLGDIALAIGSNGERKLVFTLGHSF